MKIVGIVLLALLQLIPLFMVEGLLTDRLSRRDAAIQEITSTWGSDQQILGPVLVVPFAYTYTEKKQSTIDGRAVAQESQVTEQDNAFFLPAHLKIEASATPKKLHRGIYEAVVYDADLELSGDFTPPHFAPFKLANSNILWKDATLAFPVHDLRGVQEKLQTHFGNGDFTLLPGSTLKFYGQGIHAEVPLLGTETAPIPFHLHLAVRGSANLQFAPIGVENVVHLTSTWRDPSFNGPFPPADRHISGQGFDATWRISYYGRNFPQQWRESEGIFKPDDLTNSLFGVQFMSMIDSYRSVERSLKYGILFIGLVFVTFFLFEVLARLRLHLIQYALVSAALVLFYLVLLSLSEFLSFGLSYFTAAALSTLLIGAYCAWTLGSLKRTLGLAAGLAAVYGALFIILQLEDYSLIVGTALIFAALTTVMYVTRNVNWYSEMVPRNE